MFSRNYNTDTESYKA